MEPITRLELYLTCIIHGETPPEPITRLEFYLAKIAGAAVDIPTPETRIELYLAKIAGESVLIPSPITRIEMYLAKIAGADVQIPTPITRIEMLLYDWAQAPVGESVTVTGVSPLLLEGAVAGYLASLLQRGKCTVENGAIKCNNGALVVPNLADMSESNVVVGKFINNEGGESSSSSNFYCAELIPVEAGADYTMHTSIRIGYYSVMEYDANGDFIKRTLYGSNNYRAGDIITHTMGESTAFIRWGSNPKYQAITYDYVIGIDWMLSKGSTAQEFVPYKKAVASGTAEVITATSGDTAGAVDLLAVGSVADTQDIVSGEVTRRTAAILYDGTQDVGKPYLSSTGALDVGAIIVHAPGTEYSGAVATFDAEAETPINAAIISMEPVQDLHGYDKPWAGGAGKNLCPLDGWVVGQYNNGNWEAYKPRQTSPYIAITPSVAYTMTIDQQQTQNISWINYNYFDASKNWLGNRTTNGDSEITGQRTKTFTIANTSAAYVRLTVMRASDRFVDIDDVDIALCTPQLELGDTATSYAPYSNECPITGWTEATLTKAGKNLVDVADVTGVTAQTQIGAVTLPAGDYAMSAYISNSGSAGAGVRITRSDNTTIKSIGFSSSTTASRYSGTFTLAEDTSCKIFVVGTASGYNASVSDVQVEAGTTATEWEPYVAATDYNKEFPLLAGTVYGGTIDIVNGTLTVDRALFAGTDWRAFSKGVSGFYGRIYLNSPYLRKSSTDIRKCRGNLIPVVSGSTYDWHANVAGTIGAATQYLHMYVPFGALPEYNEGDNVTTLFNAKYDATAFRFVLPIEPVVYQLTPQQIDAIVGGNVFSSDAGSIEIWVQAAPTVESAAPQAIRLVDGDNTLTVTAAVSGIELTAEYMAAN